ncbi:zinc metalloprotease [Hymenobacter weizhouensis]|uniref:hypothetical protein n=1 Tax=Hymenobacter sp. YIM 151500-1 TaxID=2987689 RepID=UPI0022271CDF|nr:hypothetical protein [Hymenobacter sp. YIM 151500-1]UYZ64943.1 hypothetical protein OIS53_08840 [Hymenobacter sp. YIM 151500-1]
MKTQLNNPASRNTGLLKLSGLLLSGLILAACEGQGDVRPAASAAPVGVRTAATVVTTDSTNILPLGHYRAERILPNVPTLVIVRPDSRNVSTNANTPELLAALDRALAQYNALNLNIKFSRTEPAPRDPRDRSPQPAPPKRYYVTVYNYIEPPKAEPLRLALHSYTSNPTTRLISGSVFPSGVNGGSTVEIGRSIYINLAYGLAASPNALTNVLLKELGHVIGIENTDPKGSYLPGTTMIGVDYFCDDLRYTKKDLNGNPLLVPGTAAATPDVTSVFSLCGPAFGTAPAALNATDKAVLQQLFGKR